MSGVGMYEPRPDFAHTTCELVPAPAAGVMSPLPPGLIAKMGRSGARPLATMTRFLANVGVGAVIFELPPRCHFSAPVSGSYPRMKFEALVTSSGAPCSGRKIVGVPHDGSSLRIVF